MYKIILSNQDLKENVATKDEIIEKIKNMDINAVGISTYVNTYKEKHKVAFVSTYIKLQMEKSGFLFEDLKKPGFIHSEKYSEIRGLINKVSKSNTELVATQGLLQFLKYMYVFNDHIEKNSDELVFDFNKEKIAEIIEVQLMINDLIQIEVEDADLLHYMMIKFSNDLNLKGLLSRTWYVYCKLALDKEKLGITENQFLDFNSEFLSKYQFDVEEFLAVYFYTFAPFYQEYEVSPYLNLNNYFNNAKNGEKSNAILKSLVCSYEDFKSYSKENIDKTFDFEILTKTPLLEISKDVAIIPSKAHLQAYLLNNFRKKMESLYNAKGNKFSQFLGFPFETYIQELCDSSIMDTSIEGKKEFYITGDYKSSEYYMRQDSTMLVIEVKSKDIPREKIFSNYDINMVQGLVKDQFIDPIFQIDRSIQEILRSTHKSMFDGITEIIGIVVTYENTHLSVEEYQKYAINKIVDGSKALKTNELKYYINLSIEEFECLCWLIESEYDVFGLLKEFYNVSSKLQLYNFLSSKGIAYEVVPSLVNKNWQELSKNMKDFFVDIK